MTRTPQSKDNPKPSDAERHARFVAMAKEVEVDESPDAFDRAFETVVKPAHPQKRMPRG